MVDKWACLLINIQFHRGDFQLVATSIRRIFGKDLKEIRFVCNDVMRESGEYYCFILCSNYFDHLNDLKGNTEYYHIIPCCEKPNFLTHSEVDKFVSSVDTAKSPNMFKRGDLVLVKEGHMKNLHGLIIQEDKKGQYLVSFRFYLKQFVKSLPVTSMKVIDNLFKHGKFPIIKKISGRVKKPCRSSSNTSGKT